MDLCLILDSSATVREYNWLLTKRFAVDLINMLNISRSGVRVGVITYSNEAHLDVKMKDFTSMDALGSTIIELPFLQSTSYANLALKLAREECFTAENGGRHDAIDVAIFLTDGPSRLLEETINEGIYLKKANVEVYTIGVESFDINELVGIARSGLHIYTVPEFQRLSDVPKVLLSDLCTKYEDPRKDMEGQIPDAFDMCKSQFH